MVSSQFLGKKSKGLTDFRFGLKSDQMRAGQFQLLLNFRPGTVVPVGAFSIWQRSPGGSVFFVHPTKF